jgi:hypothetical protein
MISDVDIINSAFSKIGVESIGSISEESKAGRLAKRTYPLIRDSLIYDHYWNFAIQRKSLALDPTPALGGGNRFILPADCHRPIRLMSRQEYKIESGFLVAPRISEAILLYVWKNINADSYTTRFREALADKLAAEWAYPMVQSVSLAERMEKKAKNSVLDAAATDAQEDYMDTVHDNTFLNAHWNETDYPADFGEY